MTNFVVDKELVEDNFDKLLTEITDRQDVWSVPMEHLRDLYGAERLGPNVRNGIQSQLSKRGIGTQPVTLPDDGKIPVRMYRKGSAVDMLLNQAIFVVKDPKANAENDRLIRRLHSDVSSRPISDERQQEILQDVYSKLGTIVSHVA